jgi:xylulose-5-phosphate/fructose-6-phosphate phosphoketolase
VICAFHGYQRGLHAIVHGRPRADRFHVRGFNEQGTTTTPFDMVVLNQMSRYHLAIAAHGRVARFADRAPALVEACRSAIESAVEYAREHFEDPPDIQNWIWTD